MADIKNIKLGTTQVQKLFAGDDLVFEYVPPDVTAPITTPRPAAGTFTEPQTIWLDVNEVATTYFTTDGSTPSTASPVYSAGIYVDKTTTLKYFSVDTAGNAEAVKTSTYTINLQELYRYVRYQGFGDNASAATTRLVELQAMEGATNRLLNKTPISGEAVNAGAGIAAATDNVVNMASGTYPIWWSGAGIPTLTYDLGASYAIDTLKLWMFSTVNDPRQTKFKLWVSKDNVNWTLITDKSTNTAVQPADGWAFAI